MNISAFRDYVFLAASQVQKDPGPIVGPIARVFGYIIDFIFNIVYALTVDHSLGLSIILLTFIVRALMLPLGIKSQKSMMNMSKLNPEVAKIREKYGKTKDPEIQRKMNTEIQALYAKNKVNPLGGCLPMLVQMPLFFGLIYIMNQSYLYITQLRNIYHQLSALIQKVPAYTNYFVPLALPHVPPKMLEERILNMDNIAHMSKVINKFSLADWNTFFAQIPPEYLPEIKNLFDLKHSIEVFFGLPLLEASGWALPGILIPVFVALTTFLSSWLSQQINKPQDDKAKTQQQMMLVVMPFVMGFLTVNFPAGVGLYWIASSAFQVAQQLVMNARAGIKLEIPFIKTKT